MFRIWRKFPFHYLVIIFFVIIVYTITMLSVIRWGIPNTDHPFTYNMDEWHQLSAVRSVFKHGSPNVAGSAHGSMLQFFLSGIYLIPFVLFKIINPFAIKSSLDLLSQQEKLFIVLRLNTLLFGVASIIVLAIIAKKYLKINPVFPVIFFTFSPIWLSLSNYFKYDIALTFWILLSLWFAFHCTKNPTKKNFWLLGFVSGLALATKLSAIPIILFYAAVFFLFPPKKNCLATFFTGFFVLLITFLLLGIPDVLLGRGDYREFLYTNIIAGPGVSNQVNLGMNYQFYLWFKHYPLVFGYGTFSLFLLSFFYWFGKFVFIFKKDAWVNYKKQLLLCIGFLLFYSSLIPLKLDGTGNRVLVLLPFMSLITSQAIDVIACRLKNKRVFLYLIIALCIFVQLFQSYLWIHMRLEKSPQQLSSSWAKNHLPKGTVIGIENIPIYQFLPDTMLKEYYEKERNKNAQTRFAYTVVTEATGALPGYVVISDAKLFSKYFPKSSKKRLVNRLQKNGYKEVAVFSPSFMFYHFIGNDIDYHYAGLLAAPYTLSVYKK